MNSVVEIDKKKMHDLKSAVTATGYSRDYVSRLAREGKILAVQLGRQWYVDLNSLKQHALVSELEQKVRQIHLSAQRKHDREKVERIDNLKAKKVQVVFSGATKAKVTAVFLLGAFLFGGFGSSVYIASLVDDAKVQVAAVSQSARVTPLETALYGDMSQERIFIDEGVVTSELAAAEQGILLLPTATHDGQIRSAIELFSDEVEIQVSDNGQTFIVPVGESASTSSSSIEVVTVPLNNQISP